MTNFDPTIVFDLASLCLLVAAGVALGLHLSGSSLARSLGVGALLATALGAATSIAWARYGQSPDLDAQRFLPDGAEHRGFVSSTTCRACHPGNYDSWHQTFHRTMTQRLSPEATVLGLGDGDSLAFEGYGQHASMTRRGDEYWVEFTDPEWELEQHRRGREPPADGPRSERRLLMTTGSHHFQVFWYGSKREGELWQFPWRYHIAEDRWIHRHDVFLHPPETPMEGDHRVWNSSCTPCHTVAGQPGLNGLTNLYTDTNVGELGIGCESCHGPASEHVARNQNPLARYAKHLSGEGESAVVNPGEMDPAAGSEVCGQCHTHYAHKAPNFARDGIGTRAGEPLEGYIHVMAPSDPFPAMSTRFWADGNTRSGGREYNGMTASPCFVGAGERQISCMSCHSMHRSEGDERPSAEWTDDMLKPGMRENEACTQCHPQLAAPAALTQHTHHAPESAGSRCYDCHMPHTSYALFKGIRTHQIDSPAVRPVTTHGRPNACNLCHLDQTLAWTGRQLASWYDTPEPELTADEREVAASILWLTKGDAGQRAIAAWHMGWEPARAISGETWLPPYLAEALADDYFAVRYVAWRSLRRLQGPAAPSFDANANLAQRRALADELVASWRAKTDPAAFAPQLLTDPEGRARVARLHAARDPSRVSVTE